MSFVIHPGTQASVSVDGSEERFPVRRIYCVGRNYRAHAIEMGADPDREPPFFFMKPADAIVEDGAIIPYSLQTENLHHEIELVVALGKGGVDIDEKSALDYVWGYGVGIDLTRRDIQNRAKEMGRPWDMGKGFDYSAPCSALRPVSKVGHPDTTKAAIWIKVNGQTRQESTLDLHIWTVAETISYLSGLMELNSGDVIFMGTPDGVAPVVSGDVMQGHIDGVGNLTVTIA